MRYLFLLLFIISQPVSADPCNDDYSFIEKKLPLITAEYAQNQNISLKNINPTDNNEELFQSNYNNAEPLIITSCTSIIKFKQHIAKFNIDFNDAVTALLVHEVAHINFLHQIVENSNFKKQIIKLKISNLLDFSNIYADFFVYLNNDTLASTLIKIRKSNYNNTTDSLVYLNNPNINCSLTMSNDINKELLTCLVDEFVHE